MPKPEPGEPSGLTIDASPMRTTLLVAGSLAFALLWQGMMPGPLVNIGPRGLRDVRVSPEWIPWAAIVGISEANHAVILKVDPTFARAMPLTCHAGWISRLNAPLGFRGLYIQV